jgi:hypothetical protein
VNLGGLGLFVSLIFLTSEWHHNLPLEVSGIIRPLQVVFGQSQVIDVAGRADQGADVFQRLLKRFAWNLGSPHQKEKIVRLFLFLSVNPSTIQCVMNF